MSIDLMLIRTARLGEEGILSKLSFASKRYWQYPEHYYTTWQSELTITPVYLEQNSVCVIEDHDKIVGYFSMALLEEDFELLGETLSSGYWLDHMFILPDFIGRGIGTKLFAHAHDFCETRGIATFYLLADPYAKGFYETMGCRYVRDVPSTIEGRTTPLLQFDLPSPE